MRRRLLFCAGFLLMLLLGEGLLHVFDPFDYDLVEDKEQYAAAVLDPQTGRLRPGAVASYLGTPTRISAQGLRNPVVAEQKPADAYRILCLGGSVVFGWGVGEGDEYPRLLEAQLRGQAWPVGRRVEVINAGVPGRLGAGSIAYLREEGRALQPDLVCLLLVATDLGVKLDLGMQRERSFLSPGLRQIRLLRALENRLVYGGLGNRVGGDHSVEREVGELELQLLAPALAAFGALCREMGAQPMVVDTLGHAQVRALAARAGVWHLDGFVPAARRRAWEVAPTDPHMGVAGHRHYAELIAKDLLGRELK